MASQLEQKGKVRLEEIIHLLVALSESQPLPVEKYEDQEDPAFVTQKLSITLPRIEGTELSGGWISVTLVERRKA